MVFVLHVQRNPVALLVTLQIPHAPDVILLIFYPVEDVQLAPLTSPGVVRALIPALARSAVRASTFGERIYVPDAMVL